MLPFSRPQDDCRSTTQIASPGEVLKGNRNQIMESPAHSIDRQLEGSEIYYGAELCKQKFMELLEQHHLPRSLLPVELEEFGINRETGFFSIKQKNRKDHNFRKIGRLISYAPVITAFVEDRRLRKITGVKSKELFVWISVCDVYIDDPASRKITFKTPAGISKTFLLESPSSD